MRLKQINLAGFKSFPDPTHIPIPGRLVGLVGPNGCGKSNIIDAVRWVLGETSARHLRGESMQDVLFAGSGQRPPVHRATVELVFDNSLGRAGGQWSSYAEISVKRVFEREGEASAYYINNQRVRRRDVADIFLGTGLGSRAYAIIEQGMISRVIEARPEELRVFLEEAAGVSKYRERRHETELRLADTRDNLLRVDDIRGELERQIEHLSAQAEVAARYRELQARLATVHNLVTLLRRREAAAARARHRKEIERLALEIEAETAGLREAESRLERARAEQPQAAERVQAAQAAFYEANAETARLEQEIAHLRESRARIEREIGELESARARAAADLESARASGEEWRARRARAAERLAEREAALAAENQRLPVAEEAYRATHSRRDEAQLALAAAQQAHEVEQTKRAHAEQVLESLAQRRQRLIEEREGLESPDARRLAVLREQIAALERELAQARERLAAHEAALPELERAARESAAAQEAASRELDGLEARRQALEQLQQRIVRGTGVGDWLEARGLADARRLWQTIRIEAGWEDALEAVLRERLNAIALEPLEQVASWFAAPPPGKLALYAPSAESAPPARGAGDCEPLARYVSCADARAQAVVADWLHGVYVVPDAAAGLREREHLAPGALLVTPEGHVFTRHGMAFHAPDSELHGVLARERELAELGGAIASARSRAEHARRAALAAQSAVDEERGRLEQARQTIAEAQQRAHALELEALRLAELNERVAHRRERIALELAEIAAAEAAVAAERAAAEQRIAGLRAELESARQGLALADELYGRAEQVLERQRQAVQRARDEAQQAAFELQRCEARIAEIGQAAAAAEESAARCEAALAARRAELARCDESAPAERLQRALEQRGVRERELAQARDAQEELQTALRAADEERHACERRLEPLRERLAELRLKEQEARLGEEAHARALAEAGAREDELAAELEKGARAPALQAEAARLNQELEALGAVNLAALEELAAARERKSYLDAQARDLTEAIATLEDAIRRIDRETRERLQRTFDEVNRHLAEMFPLLFGGGSAQLLLTGEEILEAGVQVRAQPPGKKTTTIHLLSGGEKALAALALVFSLFQLNPAPFCLLDEVDAPLDDQNTERFCGLVKKMAQQSQFLFISHNKITMEMAEQLLGITMQEPGVSRVVAVDIEEAMKFTEEAA